MGHGTQQLQMFMGNDKSMENLNLLKAVNWPSLFHNYMKKKEGILFS